VAFLDSDDEFAPTKLERQLTLFTLRPELGFVYSDFAFIDLDGVHHPSVFDAKFPLSRQVFGECVAPGLSVIGNRLFDTLIRGYFIACPRCGGPTSLGRSSAIRFASAKTKPTPRSGFST
jgi:hypothetical protein